MPLTWAAQQQGATAKATQEAEIVAKADGFTNDAIPIQELLSRMLRRAINMLVREDNEAAMVAARKGYSPALRHLPRVQRISIGSVNELFYDNATHDQTCGALKLIHHVTTTHKADVFTKTMTPKAFRDKLELMRARQRKPAPSGARSS